LDRNWPSASMGYTKANWVDYKANSKLNANAHAYTLRHTLTHTHTHSHTQPQPHTQTSIRALTHTANSRWNNSFTSTHPRVAQSPYHSTASQTAWNSFWGLIKHQPALPHGVAAVVGVHNFKQPILLGTWRWRHAGTVCACVCVSESVWECVLVCMCVWYCACACVWWCVSVCQF